jgi:DNA ligase-1
MNILYHKAKGGDMRQWRIWTEGAVIVTEHGQVGGKLQQSRKTATGKNLGKTNETSPAEQAKLEAQALYDFKLKRKYSETQKDAQEPLVLPMLAHKFDGRKAARFVWPGYAQPKLDGVRCLARRDANGDIQLTSRNGLSWNVPLIAQRLAKWLPDDMIVDGEIYMHGTSCQAITSLVKSACPKGKSYKVESESLEYHIYDVPSFDGKDEEPWDHRLLALERIVRKHEIVVPTFQVGSMEELKNCHGEFIVEGYEGTIVRASHGLYLWGYRSDELLKYKDFQDAEFRVLDARDGKGKMEGCVIWRCQVGQLDFECSMKTTMEERRKMFCEQNKYIGKMLTVRYFNLTDDGIPRFPVGIVFRNNEDL